ncbi:MAG TPA: plastocyanin/azurin family copper-binding protein, partial [Chloroflexota bacterium]
YQFAPKNVSVKVGTKVTWTNKTDAPHTVTGKNGWSFHSKTFQPKGTVSYTFSKAGTYHYICSIHPFMKATIVVTK